jgi:hypothetical protein
VSRWPTFDLDAAARRYEHEELLKRVLALDIRYGCFAKKPELSQPIVDRDPGDED